MSPAFNAKFQASSSLTLSVSCGLPSTISPEGRVIRVPSNRISTLVLSRGDGDKIMGLTGTILVDRSFTTHAKPELRAEVERLVVGIRACERHPDRGPGPRLDR